MDQKYANNKHLPGLCFRLSATPPGLDVESLARVPSPDDNRLRTASTRHRANDRYQFSGHSEALSLESFSLAERISGFFVQFHVRYRQSRLRTSEQQPGGT